MEKKTTVSRGESWGIKAAHGTKWLICKLKAFDKRCVAKAKSKNRPSWLGHIPLVSITLAVIALLAYFSLYILFVLGTLLLLYTFLVFSSINDFSENKDQPIFDWKVGHYDMDGFHEPDGSIDHNDR